MNDVLKELFLADNKLMPTDGIQIGSLLKYNHVLELLDLRNNPLQVSFMGKSIKNMGLITVQSISHHT